MIASFDTREDLLAAMRRSVGWILVDEPALLDMLRGPHPPLSPPVPPPAPEDEGQDDGRDAQQRPPDDQL